MLPISPRYADSATGIDVPAPVVNSGNFEGCHFQHWGARERVKRRAVCNRGSSRGCILLWAFLSLSLSLALKCWKWQPKELPELTTGGGFHFTFFYLLDWTSFSLNNGNLFFPFFFFFLFFFFFFFFKCSWQPCFFYYLLDSFVIFTHLFTLFWDLYVYFLNAFLIFMHSKNVFECIRESRMHSKIWSDFVKSSLYY